MKKYFLVRVPIVFGLFVLSLFALSQTVPLPQQTLPLTSSGFAVLSPSAQQTGALNISGAATVAKLNLPTGAAGTAGTSTLVAGTVTVNTTAVTASSIIVATCHTAGGTQGILTVPTRTAATSFVITSSNAADTSTVDWIVVN
jgi:hypothetical protein